MSEEMNVLGVVRMPARHEPHSDHCAPTCEAPAAEAHRPKLGTGDELHIGARAFRPKATSPHEWEMRAHDGRWQDVAQVYDVASFDAALTECARLRQLLHAALTGTNSVMATTSVKSLLDGHAQHARLQSGGQVLYATEILRRIARAEETATLNQRRVQELEREVGRLREAALEDDA